jgi:CrcB protein
MNPTAAFLVFLGAGLGGLLRHGINLLAAQAGRPGVPMATLAVNVLGSFAAGILVAHLTKRGDTGAALQAFGLTGFLGGFTTFSAYSIDAVRFIERGQLGAALGYAGGTVLLSLLAAGAGIALGRAA